MGFPRPFGSAFWGETVCMLFNWLRWFCLIKVCQRSKGTFLGDFSKSFGKTRVHGFFEQHCWQFLGISFSGFSPKGFVKGWKKLGTRLGKRLVDFRKFGIIIPGGWVFLEDTYFFARFSGLFFLGPFFHWARNGLFSQVGNFFQYLAGLKEKCGFLRRKWLLRGTL